MLEPNHFALRGFLFLLAGIHHFARFIVVDLVFSLFWISVKLILFS